MPKRWSFTNCEILTPDCGIKAVELKKLAEVPVSLQEKLVADELSRSFHVGLAVDLHRFLALPGKYDEKRLTAAILAAVRNKRLLLFKHVTGGGASQDQASNGGSGAQSKGGKAALAAPPQERKPPEKTYIGIRVVDEEGLPVDDVQVKIVGPGRTMQGTLKEKDKFGSQNEDTVRTAKIFDEGMADISFPELYDVEWS